MSFDLALVVNKHTPEIQKQWASTKPSFDKVTTVMDGLKTKKQEDGSKMLEINKTEQEVIDHDSWYDWVNAHVDDVMGNIPVDSMTSETREFRKEMISAMRMMKSGDAHMKQGEIVELSFEVGAEQFLFGYCAVCVNDREKKEMHVAVSGFGKKWQQAVGMKMDRPWWDSHADDVKGFLRHGALDQLKGYLRIA